MSLKIKSSDDFDQSTYILDENKEKERDKIKHDRMMDRARMKDTIAKNRES